MGRRKFSQKIKFRFTVESLWGSASLVDQPVWIEAQRRGQKVIMASSTSGSALAHKEDDSSMIVWSAPAEEEEGLVFKPTKGKNKCQAVKGGIILQATMFLTKEGDTYMNKYVSLTLRQAQEMDSRKSRDLGKRELDLACYCNPSEPVSSTELEIGLGYCSLKLSISYMSIDDDEVLPQTALMLRLKRKAEKIRSGFLKKVYKSGSNTNTRQAKYQVKELSEEDNMPIDENGHTKGQTSPLDLQNVGPFANSAESMDDEKGWHIHFDTNLITSGSNTINNDKDSVENGHPWSIKEKKQKFQAGQDDWFLSNISRISRFKTRPRIMSEEIPSSVNNSPMKMIRPLEWKNLRKSSFEEETNKMANESSADNGGNNTKTSSPILDAVEKKYDPKSEVMDGKSDADSEIGSPEANSRQLGSFQVGRPDESDDFGYSLAFQMDSQSTTEECPAKAEQSKHHIAQVIKTIDKSPKSSTWRPLSDDINDAKNLRELRMFEGVLDRKDKLSEENEKLRAKTRLLQQQADLRVSQLQQQLLELQEKYEEKEQVVNELKQQNEQSCPVCGVFRNRDQTRVCDRPRKGNEFEKKIQDKHIEYESSSITESSTESSEPIIHLAMSDAFDDIEKPLESPLLSLIDKMIDLGGNSPGKDE